MKKIFLFLILGLFLAGARNPFEPIYLPKEGLERAASIEDYELRQLKLKAVLWGGEKSAALFEAQDGKTFIVRVGAKVGKKGGKVITIGDKMVVVEGAFGKETFKIKGP